MSNTTPQPDVLRDAITYTVKRIAQDPAVYYHFLGTESWSRLLDAYAEITGQNRHELEIHARPDEDDYREQCETENRRAALDRGEAPTCAVCDARYDEGPDIPESRLREIGARFPQLLDAYDLIPDYDKPALRSELAAAAY